MKRRIPCAVLAVFICLACCGCAARSVEKMDSTPKASRLIASLAKGDFQGAEAMFDPELKNELPVETLEKTWRSLCAQLGSCRKWSEAKRADCRTILVTCAFDKCTAEARVTFNDAGYVTGFWLIPSTTHSPPYSSQALYTQSTIYIHNGKFTLPGVLLMPNNTASVPGIVLVHGSGSADRDETIGPNKPFRDLAEGLASKGIAVLRYDKRTLIYPEEFSGTVQFTVEDEVISDARAAVLCLMRSPGVNARRVFVLGHSLGGMLAPRIANERKDIAGLIIMAGPTRQLEDVMREQERYLASLGDTLSEPELQRMQELDRRIANVKGLKSSTSVPSTELPLGIPASYWLDLRKYHPADVAETITQPMLIMQGGKDYQVTRGDYADWKAHLATRRNVTFKFYPSLSHLFMPGGTPPSPSDYQMPAHVTKSVIDDIAGWIRSISR